MSQPPKRWVFSCLVQDKEDPQQLIAYAIYKSHKEERAQRNKKAGMTDDEIRADLARWHDEIALDQRILKTYKTKAFDIISAVIEGANQTAEYRNNQIINDLKQKHQNHCDSLSQQITDAKIIAKEEWANHVACWTKQQNARKGTRKLVFAIFTWVGGTLSGAVGGLFIILVIGGITAVCSNDTRKAANSALKYAVDYVLPENIFPKSSEPSDKTELEINKP